MIQKIIAFFMTIIAFFMQLFGLAPKPKPQPPATYQEYLNVAYGASERQVFDLYIPENAQTVPLILFIHGGGWAAGDKNTYTETAKANAKNAGFAAASINYRYIGQGVKCDDLMADITSALAKIKEFAASKGVTINQGALCGYSAGAHMSLLYAYKYASSSPVPLKFVVSQAGPTDLTDMNYLAPSNTMGEDTVLTLFGFLTNTYLTKENFTTPEVTAKLREYSPVTYVNAGSLPTIMAHGAKDNTVPFSNASALDKALTAAGVDHTLIVYPNSDHYLNNDVAQASEFINVYSQYAQKYFK